MAPPEQSPHLYFDPLRWEHCAPPPNFGIPRRLWSKSERSIWRVYSLHFSFFDHDRRRVGLTLIHDIFFFHPLNDYTGFCFQRAPLVFPRLHSCSRIHRAFFSGIDRFIFSSGSAHPVAENSCDRVLYDFVHAGYEFWYHHHLPIFSKLRHFYQRQSRSKHMKRFRNGLRKRANNRRRRPFWKLNLSSSEHSAWRLYS